MRWRLWAAASLLGIVAVALATFSHGAPSLQAVTPPTRIAVMGYFPPGDYWSQLSEAAPGVAYAVVNPASGPGDKPDAGYAAAIAAAQQQGIAVYGYVHTSYGARAPATVKGEIDRYFRWYGVDGVFIDETSIFCSYQPYFQDLHDYVKTTWHQATVVLDPGWANAESECYLSAADMLVTFEGSYQTYVTTFPAVAWTAKYPANRFWHLVYDVPSPVAIRYTIALSRIRGAGTVDVSPEQMPNPWDKLPSGDYWATEVGRQPCLTGDFSSPSLPDGALQLCSPATATVQQALVFKATVGDAYGRTASGVSFTWDFGDGQTATGAQVSHTYAAPAVYHLRVTAVSADHPAPATVDDYLAVLVDAPAPQT